MALTLRKLHEAIAIVARVRGNNESVVDYLKILSHCVGVSKSILKQEDFNELSEKYEKPTQRFVYACLYLLKKLAELSKGDTAESLISIQQQQKIKTMLQLVFSIGVFPCLMKGVNVPLMKITKQLNLYLDEKWTIIEHHNFLTFAVRELLEDIKTPNLRALILNHLGDLLSALLQILQSGKIRKPDGTPIPDPAGGHFIITPEWYNRLLKERVEFIASYKELTEGIYKPMIIKELLLLLIPQRPKDYPLPKWLDNAITMQLSGYLISPGGVAMTMRACCPSNTETVEWKKVQTMAKLISTVHLKMDHDAFYTLISPQIISLLNTTGTYCVPVAKMCIKRLLEFDPVRCQKYIFDQLFEPFIMCSKPVSENFQGTLISEEALGRCIDHIRKCFTNESKETSLPFEALTKIIKIKFLLYIRIRDETYQQSRSSTELGLQELIAQFLNAESDIPRLVKIYNALLFDEPHPDMLDMNKQLTFEMTVNGGVQVVRDPEFPTEPHFMVDNMGLDQHRSFVCERMLDLVAEDENNGRKLMFDLFLAMLTSLMGLLQEEDSDTIDIKPDLLDVQDIVMHVLVLKEKKIFTTKLLCDMAEHWWVEDAIQKKPVEIIKLLTVLMEKNVDPGKLEEAEAYCEEEDEELTDYTLIIPMRIVDIMTKDLKPGSDVWKLLEPILGPLQTLKSRHPLEHVRNMSAATYQRILTQGAVKKNEDRKRLGRKDKNHKNPKQTSSSTEKKTPTPVPSTKKDTLAYIIDLINDPLVPTRGHGLIELEKKLAARDKDLISRKDEVLVLIKHCLVDSDSYIYLAAINALESMCYISSDKAICYLCDEYLYKTNAVDTRLKIGEAMIRVLKKLPDLKTEHKNRLINTFVTATKHNDEFIRASSITNLGEIVKYFGTSCTGVMQELVVCISAILLTDPVEYVRCSAVLVARLLVSSFSGANLASLENIPRDVYRLLVQVSRSDKCDEVRLSAQQALAQLNEHMQEELTKPRPIEKKISICDHLLR